MLGLQNRAELPQFAMELGLLAPDSPLSWLPLIAKLNMNAVILFRLSIY